MQRYTVCLVSGPDKQKPGTHLSSALAAWFLYTVEIQIIFGTVQIQTCYCYLRQPHLANLILSSYEYEYHFTQLVWGSWKPPNQNIKPSQKNTQNTGETR